MFFFFFGARGAFGEKNHETLECGWVRGKNCTQNDNGLLEFFNLLTFEVSAPFQEESAFDHRRDII